MGILGEHGIAPSGTSSPMESRVRMRGAEFGGDPEGTPELYFGDPDGIVVQLQDSSYCGGAGLLGEVCLDTPEPAPTEGLLRLRDYNHFTVFVTDQARSIALYQRIFGLPIDTYQGALPVLRVGSGNQFLALGGGGAGPTGPTIHHACFAVEDFDVDRIVGVLEGYGVTPRGEAAGAAGPLQSYVTMRMPDRGGPPAGRRSCTSRTPTASCSRSRTRGTAAGTATSARSAARRRTRRGGTSDESAGHPLDSRADRPGRRLELRTGFSGPMGPGGPHGVRPGASGTVGRAAAGMIRTGVKKM